VSGPLFLKTKPCGDKTQNCTERREKIERKEKEVCIRLECMASAFLQTAENQVRFGEAEDVLSPAATRRGLNTSGAFLLGGALFTESLSQGSWLIQIKPFQGGSEMTQQETREKVDEAIQKIPGAITKETIRSIDGNIYVNVKEEDIKRLLSKQFEPTEVPSVTSLIGFPLTSRLSFNDRNTKDVRTENGLRLKVKDPSVKFVPTPGSRRVFDEIKQVVASKLKVKEGVQIIFLGSIKLARAFRGEIYYLDGGPNRDDREYRADELAVFE
jgi:hypothetical protein